MWDDLVFGGKHIVAVGVDAHASCDHSRVEMGENFSIGGNLDRDAGDLPKNARLGRKGLLAAPSAERNRHALHIAAGSQKINLMPGKVEPQHELGQHVESQHPIDWPGRHLRGDRQIVAGDGAVGRRGCAGSQRQCDRLIHWHVGHTTRGGDPCAAQAA